jgi:hypothetical protein
MSTELTIATSGRDTSGSYSIFMMSDKPHHQKSPSYALGMGFSFSLYLVVLIL